MRLIDSIRAAEEKNIAIGHFNVSDLTALKAIVQAARSLNVPVIIGVSEGEKEFIGVKTIAAVVQSLREEFQYPVFLNADHIKTLEGIKQAIEAGFDSVIFDGSQLSFQENIEKTREAVEYVKSKNPEILVEGELGYIGNSSQLLDEIPEDAAVEGNLVDPRQAKEFVQATGIDVFAPAVGNIHGMLKYKPEPSLDIARIKSIKEAVGIPLVLHGASGNSKEDIQKAIQTGISIIHVNTEIRRAWKDSLLRSLLSQKDELAPYRILDPVVSAIQELVEQHLKIFSGH